VKSKIEVTMSSGALGYQPGEDTIDTMLRAIAVAVEAKTGADDWAEKYGVNYDCDTFMMHRYCWCEKGTCEWCRCCECDGDSCEDNCFSNIQSAPNFHHKASGLKIWWYKYIGRGMEVEGVKYVDLAAVYRSCIEAAK
jgi:hypothetical protein